MKLIISTFLLFSISFSQVNTWTKVSTTELGARTRGCVVYAPELQGYLLTMGAMADTQMYSEVLYKPSIGHWINFLPDASLYGVWADSTGRPRGNGVCSDAVFGSPYFIFKNIPGASTQFLRPGLVKYQDASYAYYQYAYNSDDRKIYYFINKWTFTYDTQLRRWDTLSAPNNPATFQGGTFRLMWGAMCYDAYNHEILLFGGGAIDAENASPGTWTFNPTTKVWTKLNPAVEPGPRALSPLVYDAKNQVIVMFGGDHLDVLYSDTWVYQCASRTWIKKTPALCPPPRAGHAFLYLPKSQKAVLIGGYDYPHHTTYSGGQYKNLSTFDMWTYDLPSDQWTLIKAFGSGEAKPVMSTSVPYAAMMAADTGDRILAISNEGGSINYETCVASYVMTCDAGQTDPSGATLGVTPGTPGVRTGPYDPAWYAQNTGVPNPDSFKTFLKTMPTNQWIKVTPPKNPNGASTIVDRVWGTRIIDPDRDQIYIWAGGHSSHGGTDVARYEIWNNRWYIDQYGDWPMEGTYSNTTYAPYFTFNNRPFMTGHTYDNYDYDVHLRKMVLVKQKYTYTYSPDKRDWDSLRIPNHAEMAGGFYNTSVTSTPYGVLCWTYRTGQSSSIAPYVLFLLDSVTHTWKKLNTTGEVVPVYSTDFDGAVYDSKRDKMLFHTKSTNPGQVFSLNFQTLVLTRLNPTGSYGSDGYFRESVYLPAQDKVLIQGDRLYNCATNAWETSPVTKASGVGSTSTVNSGYLYDRKRDLVWDCENPDLYVLRLSGGYDPDTLPGLGIAATSTVRHEFFSASPNPASGVARVSFYVPGKNDVTLRIYSAQGRLIKTLVQGRGLEGVQSCSWDGKAPAGIYICRLQAGKTLKQIKIVALR